MRLGKTQFGPHAVALGLRPHLDFGPEHLGDIENGEGFLRPEPQFIPLTHFAQQYQTIGNIFASLITTSPLSPLISVPCQRVHVNLDHFPVIFRVV